MDGEQGRTTIPSAVALTSLASVAPLIVAAILGWIPSAYWSRGTAAFAALAAGSVLLTFLGGARSAENKRKELVFSLLAMLAAFAAFLLPLHLGIALLIAGFFLIALWSVVSSEDGLLPLWYGKLTSIVCGAAIVSLIAVLVRVILS